MHDDRSRMDLETLLPLEIRSLEGKGGPEKMRDEVTPNRSSGLFLQSFERQEADSGIQEAHHDHSPDEGKYPSALKQLHQPRVRLRREGKVKA